MLSPIQIRAGVAGAVLAAASVGALVTDAVPDEARELVQYQIKCNQAHAFHDAYIYSSTGGRMAFTDGEAHRPQSVAMQYAKSGIGIANSLHTLRLARDKMLQINGVYSTKPVDYEYAGLVWEAIGKPFGVDTAWGGRFNDANHFSCAWGGFK